MRVYSDAGHTRTADTTMSAGAAHGSNNNTRSASGRNPLAQSTTRRLGAGTRFPQGSTPEVARVVRRPRVRGSIRGLLQAAVRRLFRAIRSGTRDLLRAFRETP